MTEDVAAAGPVDTAALRENEGSNRSESKQSKPSEDVEAAMVKPRPDVESGAAAGGDTRGPGEGQEEGPNAKLSRLRL